MTDAEDEVQCALALLQTSIKQYGSQDKRVLGYKKCAPLSNAIRGHKFLKEQGFVTATVRVGTFVCPPYRNLAGVVDAIKRKYDTTLRLALYKVTGARRGTSNAIPQRTSRTTRASTAPRTRVRHHEVVHVSSSSEEEEERDAMEDSEDEHTAHQRDAQHDPRSTQHTSHNYSHNTSHPSSHNRSHPYEHTAQVSDQIEDEVEDCDSTEIMNTDLVLEGEDSDEDSMTRVNQSSAEQFSVRGRFELQQQKFVKDFNPRGVQHQEIMMTIKLFGATIPVPKNTLVFPPLRDLYDSSPDV